MASEHAAREHRIDDATRPTIRSGWKKRFCRCFAADIFGKTPIRGPLLVFKIIYYFTSILRWRESLAAWVKRRRAWRTKLDFVWKSGN